MQFVHPCCSLTKTHTKTERLAVLPIPAATGGRNVSFSFVFFMGVAGQRWSEKASDRMSWVGIYCIMTAFKMLFIWNVHVCSLMIFDVTSSFTSCPVPSFLTHSNRYLLAHCRFFNSPVFAPFIGSSSENVGPSWKPGMCKPGVRVYNGVLI